MTPDAPSDIKSLDREAIAEALGHLGQPRFRTRQVVHWLYGPGVSSFEEMTDLPASLRDELSRRYSLSLPEIADRQVSSDGTRKYLLRLSDGVSVEAVGLPAGGRLTVCFSSQAGCGMGCSFCATGRGGFTRNLLPGEIADQVGVVGRDFGERVSNAVAMGQGEPFANYDALLAALRLMNAKEALGIGARHLTVSTCGLVPGIRRFAGEPEQFTLAVSLHSAIQKTRDQIMPGARSYPLAELRSALIDYADTGRRPTLEYALIAGVNDSLEELRSLVEWCRSLPVHVNLIPLNPVEASGMAGSTQETARRFRDALMRSGTEASLRVARGVDIDAACGQLRQRRSEVAG